MLIQQLFTYLALPLGAAIYFGLQYVAHKKQRAHASTPIDVMPGVNALYLASMQTRAPGETDPVCGGFPSAGFAREQVTIGVTDRRILVIKGAATSAVPLRSRRGNTSPLAQKESQQRGFFRWKHSKAGYCPVVENFPLCRGPRVGNAARGRRLSAADCQLERVFTTVPFPMVLQLTSTPDAFTHLLASASPFSCSARAPSRFAYRFQPFVLGHRPLVAAKANQQPDHDRGGRQESKTGTDGPTLPSDLGASRVQRPRAPSAREHHAPAKALTM